MDAKTVNMSAVSADPTVGWHTEAGAISAANPTFVARSLTAQTLVARCQGSLELAQDSPEFGTQLMNVMAKALGVEIDRVGLEGSGIAPEPRGIKNTANRNTVTGVGKPTSYGKIVDGIVKLLAANNALEDVNKFAVMAPSTFGLYENLATGLTGDVTPLRRPNSIAAMEFLVTTGVKDTTYASPQNKSFLYLGNFANLTMGTRMEAAVEVVKASDYVGKLVYDFLAVARVDFLCTRPAAFCTLEGFTTT
jgi:HK97 family phage major capsid protein